MTIAGKMFRLGLGPKLPFGTEDDPAQPDGFTRHLRQWVDRQHLGPRFLGALPDKLVHVVTTQDLGRGLMLARTTRQICTRQARTVLEISCRPPGDYRRDEPER